MATQLRQQISNLYIRNWKNEKFVPVRQLKLVLEEEIIKQTLQECHVEPYSQAEATQSALHGGSRTFGILCIISREARIVEFVRQDGFLPANLDSRLPYEEHELKRIIPDDYREFYDVQWGFSAPIFGSNLQHRVLHDKCLLPFQKVEKKGEGGFGIVSEVSLPAKHQAIFSSDNENVGVLCPWTVHILDFRADLLLTFEIMIRIVVLLRV